MNSANPAGGKDLNPRKTSQYERRSNGSGTIRTLSHRCAEIATAHFTNSTATEKPLQSRALETQRGTTASDRNDRRHHTSLLHCVQHPLRCVPVRRYREPLRQHRALERYDWVSYGDGLADRS